MKRLVTAFGILWLVASAPNVLAVDDGVLFSDQIPVPGENSPATRALIEAWNDNGQPGSTSTYVSPCFAFNYVPSVSYLLERIEWYAGDIGGTVTTAVRGGALNGPTLGTVTYQESPPRDWQGANLVPAVAVTAGQSYYLVYSIVVGAQVSAAASGNIIPHWHDPSGACTTFNGPFNSLPWRARFYGTAATPVDTGTWGQIKSIYR
jgi:hypothetical protein